MGFTPVKGAGGSTPLSFLTGQHPAGLATAPAGQATLITMDQLDHDDTGGLANSVFTAPKSGVFTFEGAVGMQCDGQNHIGDNGRLQVFKNGAFYKDLGQYQYGSNGFDYYCSGSVTMKLNQNDTVDMRIFPTRATNFSINYLGYFSGRMF